MYNKTELDTLRDDMKEQIVDPEIEKLGASLTLIKSSVTSLSSSVAAAESSTKSNLKSIQSSMDQEKTKLKDLKRQVQGSLLRTQSNV